MHRRPLVEVTVEHSRCGREGGEGGPPTSPPQAPRKRQDPTWDPATTSPYPTAGKQKGSAGLQSTRSGRSPATAGSETDRQTGAKNNPRVSFGGSNLCLRLPQPGVLLGTGQGRRCWLRGAAPPPQRLSSSGDLASEPGPILASDFRSLQIPINPLPGWRGQHRGGCPLGHPDVGQPPAWLEAFPLP